MNNLVSPNILGSGWLSTNLFQNPTAKQLQQQSDQLAKLQQLSEVIIMNILNKSKLVIYTSEYWLNKQIRSCFLLAMINFSM